MFVLWAFRDAFSFNADFISFRASNLSTFSIFLNIASRTGRLAKSFKKNRVSYTGSTLKNRKNEVANRYKASL